ncbi:MAG TPA: hypothetical protein PK781_02695 [Terrimesophilobacter sp.]|nr:hypothetical protein [Terrimesophilobacter sp.]
MTERMVSTKLRVDGVHTDDDVRHALQALYDVFTELGIGQGTFEVERDGSAAKLWVKHLASIDVDVDAVNAALESAGHFRVIE